MHNRYLNTTTAARNVMLTIFGCFCCFSLLSQDLQPKVSELNLPEIRWAVFHPFKVKQAKINVELARKATAEAKAKYWPNATGVGDSLDAFRHAYWTLLNAHSFDEKTAISIGLAHEKANWKMMKSGRYEDGQTISKGLIAMDLFNNLISAIQSDWCCTDGPEEWVMAMMRLDRLTAQPYAESECPDKWRVLKRPFTYRKNPLYNTKIPIL